MLALASCASSAIIMNGFNGMLPAPIPVVPPQPAWQTSAQAIVSGVGAAYVSLSRPLQVGIPVAGVALAWSVNEARKRDALVSSGEECMLGDEGKCEECAPPRGETISSHTPTATCPLCLDTNTHLNA